MRFISTWILKLRLAAIFKQAEQLVQQGVETGNEQYVHLFAEAQTAIHFHEKAHKDFNVDVEVPAINDLAKLTVPPVPVDIRQRLILVCAAVSATAFSIGLFSAMVGASYHAFSHLFHFMGL